MYTVYTIDNETKFDTRSANCPRYVTYLFLLIFTLDYTPFARRCTARPESLDEGGGLLSHEHTELLLEAFNLKTLWDDYGIVGDLVVSTILGRPLGYVP